MLAVASELGGDGFRPIVIVGADIPTLRATRLHQALRVLRRADVVFGEAEDGGYYLVGTWRSRPALFDDPEIEWGGPAVLATSERIAHRIGLDTGRLPPERDTDTVDDLDRLRDHLAELELRGEPVPAHTATALSALPRG